MNMENYIVPTATFTENPEAYELVVELPGIGKEDADLHIDGHTLTLKPHATYENPAGFKQVAVEFERTNYAMSAELPEMADASAMTAQLENGLLTVTIKKKPEVQPKRIEIL